MWLLADVPVVRQQEVQKIKNVVSRVGLVDKSLPDTVDVLDGVTDLATHLLLIALHLRGAERRSSDSG